MYFLPIERKAKSSYKVDIQKRINQTMIFLLLDGFFCYIYFLAFYILTFSINCYLK